MQSQCDGIRFGNLHPTLTQTINLPLLSPLNTLSHSGESSTQPLSLPNKTQLCLWSLQHVCYLCTTEEAHLVMPSLPVSICAHQRELASKIKTESKTLLLDSIIHIGPLRKACHRRQNVPPKVWGWQALND